MNSWTKNKTVAIFFIFIFCFDEKSTNQRTFQRKKGKKRFFFFLFLVSWRSPKKKMIEGVWKDFKNKKNFWKTIKSKNIISFYCICSVQRSHFFIFLMKIGSRIINFFYLQKNKNKWKKNFFFFFFFWMIWSVVRASFFFVRKRRKKKEKNRGSR